MKLTRAQIEALRPKLIDDELNEHMNALCDMALASLEYVPSAGNPAHRPMIFKDQWYDADPETLEPWYSYWMSELTAQGIHSKAAVATCLAILSQRLDEPNKAALAALRCESQP